MDKCFWGDRVDNSDDVTNFSIKGNLEISVFLKKNLEIDTCKMSQIYVYYLFTLLHAKKIFIIPDDVAMSS